MKTKEAIEFLVKEYDVYKNTPLESGYEAVLKLLQRGEKFEEMWGELEVYIEGKSEALTMKMNMLWQKYIIRKETNNV